MNFTKVLTHFPLAMLYAFTGTYATILAARLTDPWSHLLWIKIILCCEIGMLFAIAISTFMEMVSKRKGHLMGSRILLSLLTTGYFFSFPDKLLPTDWYRFILLAALGHSLVACTPFMGKGISTASGITPNPYSSGSLRLFYILPSYLQESALR